MHKDLKHSPQWVSWVDENLQKGCDPRELEGILIGNEFSPDSIALVFSELRVQVGHSVNSSSPPYHVDHEKIAKPYLTQPDNGYSVLQMNTGKLQLYLIDDFLSESECLEIMRIGESALKPSTLTLADIDASYRTSQTCDLGLLNFPSIEKVDNRIYAAMGINKSFAEVTQIQKYEIGQEFKEHTDYFKPGTKEFELNASVQGNRTWTFMIYLNSVLEGGGTKFFAIDKVIQPKIGMAVVWNSLYPDGLVNPDTLHAGLPILRGQKYVITKWFRERPLPI
jgi:prolyl 4-hydroxylase